MILETTTNVMLRPWAWAAAISQGQGEGRFLHGEISICTDEAFGPEWITKQMIKAITECHLLDGEKIVEIVVRKMDTK